MLLGSILGRIIISQVRGSRSYWGCEYRIYSNGRHFWEVTHEIFLTEMTAIPCFVNLRMSSIERRFLDRYCDSVE